MAIACKTCGTQYEDFAEYCNECNIPLVDGSGESREKVESADSNLRALEKSRAFVALIHKIVGWLYVILLVALTSAFSLKAGNASINKVFLLLPILGLAVTHFWTASALVAGKNWARSLSIFIAVLLLFGFPLGTMFGVILLMRLFGPEWKAAN